MWCKKRLLKKYVEIFSVMFGWLVHWLNHISSSCVVSKMRSLLCVLSNLMCVLPTFLSRKSVCDW